MPERSGRRLRHDRLAVLVGVVAFVFFLAMGLIPRLHRNSQLADAVTRQKDQAVPTEVVLPRRAVDSGVGLPGSLVAIEQTVVGARATGYVAKYFVDVGSSVKAGQLMATVQAPDVDAQYRQARAQTLQSMATWRQSLADTLRLRAAVTQAAAQSDAALGAVQQAQATAASYHAKVLEAQRAFKQSEANYKYDVSQLVLAQRTYKRYKDLGKQGFISQQDVDQQEATYKSAVSKVEADEQAVKTAEATVVDTGAAWHASQSGVAAARSNLRAAQENVHAAEAALQSGQQTVQASMATVAANRENETRFKVLTGFERIVAPFDGVVTARNVSVGSLINPPASNAADTSITNTAPTTGLFGVARLNPMEIDVALPQTYATQIRNGDRALVSVREIPSEVWPGTVFAVSGALDASTRTLQIKVSVPNPIGRLRPGMYASVHLATPNQEAVLRVPTTSLVFDAHGTRLSTVTAAQRIHLQPVTVGRDYGKEIEILNGLRGNEMIVVNPTDTLSEGMRVRPVRSDIEAEGARKSVPLAGQHGKRGPG